MAKKGSKPDKPGPATVQNRKAFHDYEILETYEAGLVLLGSEVKSVFRGRAHLTDAYCEVRDGEAFVVGVDIEPYEFSSAFAPDRRRDRKLLLHRREIALIGRRAREKGLTIVPLKLYFRNGKAKLEIALARGRRQYDKRERIAKEEERRERDRALKERFRPAD